MKKLPLLIFLLSVSLNLFAQKNTTTPVPCLLSNSKYIYTDRNLKPVITTQFDSAFRFREGLAMVYSGGQYGFINLQGKQEMTAIYDRANYFSSQPGLTQSPVPSSGPGANNKRR